MDPIDGNKRALELIRRQLSERLQGLRGRDGAAATAGGTEGATPRPSLRDVVGRKIRAIPSNDVRHLEKSVQAFVETVLLDGLGEDLINNPEFRDMTTDVSRILLDDPTLRTQFSELSRQLTQLLP